MRAFAILAVLAAVSLSPGGPAAADTATICAEAEERYQKAMGDEKPPEGVVVVKMFKYTFCPNQVTVAPGTTVRWVNVERTSHSTWLKEAGVPESERLFMGEHWEFTFTEPGEYPYLCGPHWEQDGMTATVTVKP